MDEHTARGRRGKTLRPATAYADPASTASMSWCAGAAAALSSTRLCEYAEIEVTSDQLSQEGAGRLRALQEPHRSRMIQAILHTGYLSQEGKAERLCALGFPMRFEVAQVPTRQDKPGALVFKGTRRRWP